MAYHSKIHPDWARRIGSVGPEQFAAWGRQFVGASLEAAKRATDEMLAGDLKRPFAAEEHIATISRRARDITAAARINQPREESHYCLLCHDSMYVSIVHPKSVERAQQGQYDDWLTWADGDRRSRPPARRGWTSAAAFCTCRRAVAVRELQVAEATRKGLQPDLAAVYDTRRHVRWRTFEEGKAIDEVSAELIRAAIALKPVNHVAAFDDWNVASDSQEQEAFEW